MSLKRRIALNISIAFSLLFGIVMAIIYVSFNDFRKEEFKERFQKRLQFTSNFIQKSSNFERDAPLFFNENADNVLLNETIMIFNKRKELIYSTIKDKKVTWDDEMLKELDLKKVIYREKSVPEIYAVLVNIKGQTYYILTSAYDTNGQTKLAYLKYLLVFAFIVSIALIWFFSYSIVGKMLQPLVDLKQNISEVTAHKLTSTIEIKEKSNDEISVLAQSFNMMVLRLNDVFQAQKDFTSSAAHEIRTPLTRMAFQLENLMNLEQHSPETMLTLQQLRTDVYQLSDLTKSLLLLTKFDKENIKSIFEEVRIDEVIFNAYESVFLNFPNLNMNFEIEEHEEFDLDLAIPGVQSLLEIVFINLFKNAAVYSDDQKVDVKIDENAQFLMIEVKTHGDTLSNDEQQKLFSVFMRGQNSQNRAGSGLGLRIVKRILEYHKADISYHIPSEKFNVFKLVFSKK